MGDITIDNFLILCYLKHLISTSDLDRISPYTISTISSRHSNENK